MSAMRQPSPPKRPIDSSLDNIVLVDRLPSDAWAEGIAVRPSGCVLATRIDGPEVYSLDSPSEALDFGSEPIPPKVLLKFPGVNCVLNVCRLTGTTTEDYAVLTCHAEFTAAQFDRVTVWRASFDPDDENATPTVTKIADLPDAGFCLGMIAISDDILAIADTSTPCVLRLHIRTGKVSILLEDEESMGAGEALFGINRVRVAGGYLWYTNTFTGFFYRAPIKHIDAKRDIEVVGPPQAVADGFPNADGLVMTKDGTSAFITSYVMGKLWKVDIDSTGKSASTVLMGDLITPTAMDLVYKEADEKPTLYVMCCGAVSPDLLEGDRASAFAGANADTSRFHILVTITTEITVTYEPAVAAGA